MALALGTFGARRYSLDKSWNVFSQWTATTDLLVTLCVEAAGAQGPADGPCVVRQEERRVTILRGGAKFDQVGHELVNVVERSMMTATVRIPTVLRPVMDGATTVAVEGATIGDVLDHLTSAYPAAKGQLFNDDGTLHRFLNVYVNDDDVRYLGGVDAPVLNDDEITLLPAVAGGAG